MLSGILLSKIELSLRKYIPDVIKMIIIPFVTLLVTLLLSYIIIGPVSRVLGDNIALVFNYLLIGPLKLLEQLFMDYYMHH